MLLPGEAIPCTDEDISSTFKTDSEIEEKYISGDIRIVTEQARYFLDAIPKLKDVKLDVGPDYQRRGRWNNKKKSRLIESFIMNIPVPPIFLYEYKLAHFEVMDGKQRITTIQEFYNNQFSLEELEYWPELDGRYYKDLPETIRAGIDRRSISGIVLLYETAQSNPQRSRELKQLIFERINTGGVELSPQESRNAIFDGPMNHLCKELSENTFFKNMWKITSGNQDEDEEPSENYKDMTDVELVLRFFAIRQRKEFVKEYSHIKKYLNFYLSKANDFSPDLLRSFSNLFSDTIKLIHDVLGEDAFCAFRKNAGSAPSRTSRPSYLMYEPICFVFSKYITDKCSIYENRLCVSEHVTKAIIDNIDKFKGRLSNPNYIFERIGFIESALLSAMGKGDA